MEQGKDIITRDKSGCIHAFQLKTGDINQGFWRNIKGEIDALIQLPIVHPSVQKDDGHRAYLVCNGEITDEVRFEIDQINEDNVRRIRGYAYLNVITFPELLGMFIQAQGEFLPKNIEEFRAFLSLHLSDGRDFLDKNELAKFLVSSVFTSGITRKSDKIHAISSSVVLLSHLLKSFQEENNHLALFEAWGLLASEIVVFAESNKLSEGWQTSLRLALDEATANLNHLKDETLSRSDFLEGDFMGDGDLMYKGRVTIVLGALSVLELQLLEEGRSKEPDGSIVALVLNNIGRLWLWGDSAVPFLLNIVWLLEAANQTETADNLLKKLLIAITDTNSRSHRDARPLPSPYYSLSQILETQYGVAEEPVDFESFVDHSYCLSVIVQTLTRRNHREILEHNWRLISHFYVHEFIPTRDVDYLAWSVEDGKNAGYFLPETQSWKCLVEESNKRTESDLTKYKTTLRFMTLFAPQRLTPKTANILDPCVSVTPCH